MSEAAPSVLSAWESFYVIVGSSAGALTGLQFVVLTLIKEAGVVQGRGDAISAFGSPNVVHFCSALLVSAILSAPWPTLGPPGVVVAMIGAAGVLYSIAVLRRTLRQRDYQPVLEDWVWHAALPIVAYAALLDAGVQLTRAFAYPLYIVGGATLLLVFIGIHNAWDTVMYVTIVDRGRRLAEASPPAAGEGSSKAASTPPTDDAPSET